MILFLSMLRKDIPKSQESPQMTQVLVHTVSDCWAPLCSSFWKVPRECTLYAASVSKIRLILEFPKHWPQLCNFHTIYCSCFRKVPRECTLYAASVSKIRLVLEFSKHWPWLCNFHTIYCQSLARCIHKFFFPKKLQNFK